MAQYTHDDLKRLEINNLRELTFRYKRKTPILLKFSNVLFTSEGNEETVSIIEKEMGKAIKIWTEPITSEDEVNDVMVNLIKCGSNIPFGTKKATHYLYGLFPNWVVDNTIEKARLIQNLAFYEDQDFWLAGGVGENITLVSRGTVGSPYDPLL